MKVKYSSDLLLKDLRKEDLDGILSFCRKSNFKLHFGKDYLHVNIDNTIYFIGIVKFDDKLYYSINQLSQYEDLTIKDLLSKIKSIDKSTILL